MIYGSTIGSISLYIAIDFMLHLSSIIFLIHTDKHYMRVIKNNLCSYKIYAVTVA